MNHREAARRLKAIESERFKPDAIEAFDTDLDRWRKAGAHRHLLEAFPNVTAPRGSHMGENETIRHHGFVTAGHTSYHVETQ